MVAVTTAASYRERERRKQRHAGATVVPRGQSQKEIGRVMLPWAVPCSQGDETGTETEREVAVCEEEEVDAGLD